MQSKKSSFITPATREFFHVHTSICRHAHNSPEEFLEAALKIGASRIVFTDHCPFPGNPFGNRMDIEQLPDYIQSLNFLKRKFEKHIDVQVGLEVEYLPSFQIYFKKLADMEGLNLLILGQHFYEVEPEVYSFSKEDKRKEYIGLTKATLQGIKSGYFSVIAHPDRIFRREPEWDETMAELSKEIINVAKEFNILLELNASSIKKGQYKQEFWDLVPCEIKTIKGIDAHSVAELDEFVKQYWECNNSG